jgi:hypothetical protein
MAMKLETTAAALFLSPLQPSDRLDAARVAGAVRRNTVAHPVDRDSAAAVAVEYGEHPDTAPQRMRWALATAATYAPALALSA